MPEVTVVVSTRDRVGRLTALLDSLESQTLAADRFDVVVVDNGSEDTTPELLAERSASNGRLTVLARSRGSGPGPAREAGWRASSARLVAFTDDDCEATPGWLEALVDAQHRTGADIVQGATRPQPRDIHLIGPLSRTQDVPGPSAWFPTCNVMYERAALERVGGFDDRFAHGVGGEDTDLAWRVIEAGGLTAFTADAVVHHAIEPLSRADQVRIALRWSDAIAVLRLHPQLRRDALEFGVFWKGSHRRLAQAILGVALARRFAPALLLAFPYTRHLRARCRSAGASPSWAAWFAFHDLIEMYAALRGGARNRMFVL